MFEFIARGKREFKVDYQLSALVGWEERKIKSVFLNNIKYNVIKDRSSHIIECLLHARHCCQCCMWISFNSHNYYNPHFTNEGLKT